MQQGFDFNPWPLHGRITKQLITKLIGGEHHSSRELGQRQRQGGFATGRRADQKVAAEGRWYVGRHLITLSSLICLAKLLRRKLQIQAHN